jgi:hypothetical protein
VRGRDGAWLRHVSNENEGARPACRSEHLCVKNRACAGVLTSFVGQVAAQPDLRKAKPAYVLLRNQRCLFLLRNLRMHHRHIDFLRFRHDLLQA